MSSVEELRRKYDRSDMYSVIVRLPEELGESYERFSEVELPSRLIIAGRERRLDDINKVAVVGMGGSAIGGGIVYSLLSDRLEVPYYVFRSFMLPAFVDRQTLLICISYSGNTDETLAACAEGIGRGAYPVFVTSNGALSSIAQRFGIPTYRLPPGRPPRTATAFMVSAILRALEAADLIPSLEEEVKEAVSFLRNKRDDYASLSEDSLPYRLASAINGKVPLIYAYAPYTSAGFRFKTQINENAKYHAFFAELPEANHNEIMGWEGGLAASYHVVIFRGSRESEEMRARVDFWRELLSKLGVGITEVKAKGPNLLAELFYLILIGDVASYVLALMRGIDPTPVATISSLKKYVGERVRTREEVLRMLGIS